MRLTEERLRRIIREEAKRMLKEGRWTDLDDDLSDDFEDELGDDPAAEGEEEESDLPYIIRTFAGSEVARAASFRAAIAIAQSEAPATVQREFSDDYYGVEFKDIVTVTERGRLLVDPAASNAEREEIEMLTTTSEPEAASAARQPIRRPMGRPQRPPPRPKRGFGFM